MNVVGIGIDIVDVREMGRAISGKAGEKMIERTFTKSEFACAKGCDVNKFATTFAAKEATFKAFGTGWLEGHDVEVIREKDTGIPHIVLHGKLMQIAKKRKIKEALVSLSFATDYAVATVTLVT